MTEREKLILRSQMSRVFRPGSPVDKYDLFAGRSEQVRDIIRAINQPGQHVVMYGERGVGKTSLSKVLVELLSAAHMDVISPESVNCDGTDNFGSIWQKVFKQLGVTVPSLQAGLRQQSAQLTLDKIMDTPSTPDEVRHMLTLLGKPSVIVIDEVDRLTARKALTLIADTIKTLSDHSTPSTLILIGVADSVDDLIREHMSINRALVEVHMQRMSRQELTEIIDKAMTQVGMSFSEEARDYIVDLSAGLPHYPHILGLYASEIAVDADRTEVNREDVDQAINKIVKQPGSLLSAYEKATSSSHKDALFEPVLLACARAEKSDLGFFTAASIRIPLNQIIRGKKYDIPAFSGHLDAFCSEERGRILEKHGRPRQFRFRFVNPLLQPFVILHGISKGLFRPEGHGVSLGL